MIKSGQLSDRGNIVGWCGYLYEESTGMWLARHRWQIPELGRWANRDPISYAGGGQNLYEYVNGNPVFFQDPSGLASNAKNENTLKEYCGALISQINTAADLLIHHLVSMDYSGAFSQESMDRHVDDVKQNLGVKALHLSPDGSRLVGDHYSETNLGRYIARLTMQQGLSGFLSETLGRFHVAAANGLIHHTTAKELADSMPKYKLGSKIASRAVLGLSAVVDVGFAIHRFIVGGSPDAWHRYGMLARGLAGASFGFGVGLTTGALLGGAGLIVAIPAAIVLGAVAVVAYDVSTGVISDQIAERAMGGRHITDAKDRLSNPYMNLFRLYKNRYNKLDSLRNEYTRCECDSVPWRFHEEATTRLFGVRSGRNSGDYSEYYSLW